MESSMGKDRSIRVSKLTLNRSHTLFNWSANEASQNKGLGKLALLLLPNTLKNKTGQK